MSHVTGLDRDAYLTWSLRAFAVFSAALVLLIVGFLAWEARPALRDLGFVRWFTDEGWHPDTAGGEGWTVGTYNLTPMLLGSLAATAGAILLAGPLGILCAIFLHYYAPRVLAGPFRRLLELLNGVPSVVFGFWGLVALVPLIRRIEPPGPSLLAGVLILALMIVPTVALLADAALQQVPRPWVAGARALGLSNWSTLRGVALPAARQGLGVAVVLGAARAVGETMAVLMVCGNVIQAPADLFAPVRTVTAHIALELGYAGGGHRSALFVTGLMLMVLIGALLGLYEWLKGGQVHE